MRAGQRKPIRLGLFALAVVALCAVFAAHGFMFASWAVRVPAVKQQTGASAAALGLALLGHAAAASGHPGVTTDMSVRYRRPVPLDVPLRIWGRVTGTEGRYV